MPVELEGQHSKEDRPKNISNVSGMLICEASKHLAWSTVNVAEHITKTGLRCECVRARAHVC